jgi:hypothetical protein
MLLGSAASFPHPCRYSVCGAVSAPMLSSSAASDRHQLSRAEKEADDVLKRSQCRTNLPVTQTSVGGSQQRLSCLIWLNAKQAGRVLYP